MLLRAAQPAHSELPIAMVSADPEPFACHRCWTRFRNPADVSDLSHTINVDE